jgi:hypothetical protein
VTNVAARPRMSATAATNVVPTLQCDRQEASGMFFAMGALLRMRKTIALALALLFGPHLQATGPARSGAESITLAFDHGFVTIHAAKVSAAQILEQYGAMGDVEIRNLDVLPPNAITIALDRVPESTALDILTRCCGGYLATRRVQPDDTSRSAFRRIVIARAGDTSTPVALPPEPPLPPVEFIEHAPAPGEVRPRLGPDGKPLADDQEGAPQPPLEG